MSFDGNALHEPDHLSVLHAMNDAVTPEAIQSMTRFAVSFGEMADILNHPDVPALLSAVSDHAVDLTGVVVRVADMERMGQIERVIQLLSLVSSALDAMTPDIIAGLVKTMAGAIEIGDAVLSSEIFAKMPIVLEELQHVLDHPPTTEKGTVRTVMNAMRDKDVRVGLDIALTLLRRLGQSVNTLKGGTNHE